MSQLKVNSIVDANGGSNAVLYGVASPVGSMGFRNRILNGDMRIDQRNNGASVTVNAANLFYAVDRFQGRGEATDGVFTIQRSTVAPAGFTNSLLATITTADASIGSGQQYFLRQNIEGFNVADLGFGTAAANTVTLSFVVRSSVTGTFSGSLMNQAANRSYPFTYTISAANAFEAKAVTITGDTSGTWLTDNSTGLRVFWSLGAGSSMLTTANAWAAGEFIGATGQTNLIATNGATFYITGVQLEAGTVASPFERRDYGREMIMCQRYYEVIPATYLQAGQALGGSNIVTGFYRVTKRATPTLSLTQLNGSGGGSFSNTTDNWSASAAVDGNGRIGYSGTSAAEL